LGRAVAGLNAYSKGQSLGLFRPTPATVKEQRRKMREKEGMSVDLLHRSVPVRSTPAGLRALSKDRPIDPESVQRYLASKFDDSVAEAYAAMQELAASLSRSELARSAYRLYEAFRPEVPGGIAGWGAKGRLDLRKIRNLAGRLAELAGAR